MKKILFILPLLLLLSSLKGFAQDTTLIANQAPSPMLVDKLTNHIYKSVYTATTVHEGTFQLDVDFVYIVEKFGYRNGTQYKDGSLPDLKIRYGISEALELRAGTRIAYSYQKVNFRSSNFGADPILPSLQERSMLYTDFLTLGIKANAFKYHQGKGLVSILAETYIPILRAPEAFGPTLPPTLTLINSTQLTNWFSYNFNAGASFNAGNADFSISDYNFSLTPIFKLMKPLSSYIGLSKIIATHNPNFHGFNFHVGLLYSPTSTLQLRGSFSLEKNKNSPNELNKGHYSNLGLAWQPAFLRHQ